MPRVKQFSEEEVLDKAIQLFWEQGFHATSMQDLVAHLGINRASMYDTFGSKNELFQRAIQKYQSNNLKTVKHFLEAYPIVREGFFKLFERSLEMDCEKEKGCFMVNTTTELASNDERIKQSMQEARAELEKVYVAYLQRGVDQGQISPFKNLQEIAAYFYTLQSGIKVIAKIERNRTDLLRMIRMGLSVLD